MPARTPRTIDPVVRRETKRFEAWLVERQISTAPVTTWPPDEIDYYGSEDLKTKRSRTPRQKGNR